MYERMNCEHTIEYRIPHTPHILYAIRDKNVKKNYLTKKVSIIYIANNDHYKINLQGAT